MLTYHLLPVALAVLILGCGEDGGSGDPIGTAATPTVTAVNQRVVARFDNPWAMAFLPDGRALVTEKPGRLQLVTQAGATMPQLGCRTSCSTPASRAMHVSGWPMPNLRPAGSSSSSHARRW